MDLLTECAKAYKKLLLYSYHFVLGRKGKIREFILSFDEADFHHLAGLHKLRDIERLQRGKRSTVLQEILENKITMTTLQKSDFYFEMSMRLLPLSKLESILDNNQIIFHYNNKMNKYSLISADYLLEGDYKKEKIFLFLGRRGEKNGEQMCKTLFPKRKMDYTVGQEKYTLLQMKKIYLPNNEVVFEYIRETKKK